MSLISFSIQWNKWKSHCPFSARCTMCAAIYIFFLFCLALWLCFGFHFIIGWVKGIMDMNESFFLLDADTLKPQFILQGWSVVSFWSYISYFDATEPLWLTANWHPTMFFVSQSQEREDCVCASVCTSMCMFLAAHAGAARLVSHFFDWQATAVLLCVCVCTHAHVHAHTQICMEELWYFYERGQLRSVCLLSLYAHCPFLDSHLSFHETTDLYYMYCLFLCIHCLDFHP